MPSGKRYWFPDEEPEEDHPWFPDGYKGLCQFCGHVMGKGDHKDGRCPSKPLLRI